MRKLTALLLAVLMILLPAIGCGAENSFAGILNLFPGAPASVGREAETPSSWQLDETKPVEITFWAKNDTNMTQMQIYKDAIAGFEQLYPNIKVKLVPYTDYGRIYQDVLTNIPTNTTPNVCITYPDHIATYMEGGNNTVVPLDTLMNDSKYGLGGTEV